MSWFRSTDDEHGRSHSSTPSTPSGPGGWGHQGGYGIGGDPGNAGNADDADVDVGDVDDFDGFDDFDFLDTSDAVGGETEGVTADAAEPDDDWANWDDTGAPDPSTGAAANARPPQARSRNDRRPRRAGRSGGRDGADSSRPAVHGRSGRTWRVLPRQIRRVNVDCQVQLVNFEKLLAGALRTAGPGEAAVLRAGIELLSLGNPLTCVLLDVVDGEGGTPTGYITSWAAGPSTDPLDRQRGDDSLAAQLAAGEFMSPADVMEMLAPLGALLDDAAAKLNLVPIELSPDHLVHCRGSLRLVGYGRHGYRPAQKLAPAAAGRSELSRELLGDDVPSLDAPLPLWRSAQVRALARLIGWLATGRRPTAYGAVGGDTAEGDATGGDPEALRNAAVDRYLDRCGIGLRVSDLQPGSLRQNLVTRAAAARRAQVAEGLAAADVIVAYHDSGPRDGITDRSGRYERGLVGGTYLGKIIKVEPTYVILRLSYGSRVLVPRSGTGLTAGDLTTELRVSEERKVTVRVYDETPNARGEAKGLRGVFAAPSAQVMVLPKRRVNPEPIRLTASLVSGRMAVGVAAFEAADLSTRLASLLGSSGWLLCQPGDLSQTLNAIHRLRTTGARPGEVAQPARTIAFGVDPVGLAGPKVLISAGQPLTFRPPLPGADGQPVPPVQWGDLPLVDDVTLSSVTRRIGGTAGQSAARRAFAAMFAYLLVNPHEQALADRPGAGPDAPGPGGRSIINFLTKIGPAFAGRPELTVQVAAELAAQQTVWASRDSDRMLDELAGVLRSLPADRQILIDVMRLAMRDRMREETRQVLLAETLPAIGELTGHWDKIWRVTATGPTELTDALRRVAATGEVLARGPGLDAETVVELAMAGAAPAVLRLLPILPAGVVRSLADIARTSPETLRGDTSPVSGRSGTAAARRLQLVAEADERLVRRLTADDIRRFVLDDDGTLDDDTATFWGVAAGGLARCANAAGMTLPALRRAAESAGVGGPAFAAALLEIEPARYPALDTLPGRLVAEWFAARGDLELLDLAGRDPDLLSVAGELSVPNLVALRDQRLSVGDLGWIRALARHARVTFADVFAAAREENLLGRAAQLDPRAWDDPTVGEYLAANWGSRPLAGLLETAAALAAWHPDWAGAMASATGLPVEVILDRAVAENVLDMPGARLPSRWDPDVAQYLAVNWSTTSFAQLLNTARLLAEGDLLWARSLAATVGAPVPQVVDAALAAGLLGQSVRPSPRDWASVEVAAYLTARWSTVPLATLLGAAHDLARTSLGWARLVTEAAAVPFEEVIDHALAQDALSEHLLPDQPLPPLAAGFIAARWGIYPLRQLLGTTRLLLAADGDPGAASDIGWLVSLHAVTSANPGDLVDQAAAAGLLEAEPAPDPTTWSEEGIARFVRTKWGALELASLLEAAGHLAAGDLGWTVQLAELVAVDPVDVIDVAARENLLGLNGVPAWANAIFVDPAVGHYLVRRWGIKPLRELLANSHYLHSSARDWLQQLAGIARQDIADVLDAAIADGIVGERAVSAIPSLEHVSPPFLAAHWGTSPLRSLIARASDPAAVRVWEARTGTPVEGTATGSQRTAGPGHNALASEVSDAVGLDPMAVATVCGKRLAGIAAVLRTRSGLGPALRALDPPLRARLLSLADELPPGATSVDLRAAAESGDPVSTVTTAMEFGLPTEQAAVLLARLRRIPEHHRAVLRPLGALLAETSTHVLAAIATLDLDPDRLRALAMVERSHPGAVEVVALHGPSAVTLLCGSDAPRAIALLQRLDPAPGLVQWVLAAGLVAARAVVAVGPGIIEIARATASAPSEARWLVTAAHAAWEATPPATRAWPIPAVGGSQAGDELISLAVDIYRFAIKYRIPVDVWVTVGTGLAAQWPVDEILRAIAARHTGATRH